MNKKGILIKWNDAKGYGFITSVGEKNEIFVHINEFKDRTKRPSLNRSVIFTLSQNRGRPCAINVQIDQNSSIIRKKGILTKWKDNKGYGFITPVGEKSEIFVHISELKVRPSLNEKVIFTLSKDKNGRDCATNAIPFNKTKLISKDDEKNNISIFSLSTIGIFYTFLFISTYNQKIEIYLIPYYVLISVLTFYIYKKDKGYSQIGNWRVSEKMLHVLSLSGGWSGALIAQNILNHKSSKTKFKIIFYITIMLNIALLRYYFF